MKTIEKTPNIALPV